ncbi:LytS/YhcK type 5TM receptor domain-containing protein [Photobacterium toruni]|uniref:LytS/YhcK type 5TM receptor domain-containing protein n=1 Tax=Photobacterium toruni TaxID=1935446 RepID=A0A1T4L5D7_9GAMM|nr:LytS/YhcK type 5TM receptor domain-containing protein [Photobacterium toruni]MEC6814126.1 LytS/YhcK type 5TM receptor domain-containing protein [Photobacterium toruni]MEC6831764.1 LytS/YhcK type 5TM receptor domain-containing protein [Photobacterium toruni]SJZ49894.1 Sensor histidine kinase YpdA [Photobacterium toruni]
MYSEQFMMLLAVFERAALMLMTLFLLTRTQLFQSIVKKTHRRPVETAMISALFILFAVFSTYTGLYVDGSLVNVRIIAVLSGGIIFGPWIGIPAGIIAGIHRYLIDVDGPTSVACLITSIFAGLLATWIHCKCAKKNYAQLGILAGICCEILTMVLIVALSHNKEQAYNIVAHISFPMILGTLSIGLIIKLVQDLDEEQELIAAQQAKLALEIANKTLPYFRINTRHALQKVCSIIRFYTGADAVAITNTQDVRAYVGRGEEHFLDAHHKISQMTRQAVESGEQIISNNLNVHNFHSLLIIPLWENGEVSGTLKIFYCQPDHIRMSLREMAIGLSQIISTQMEVSRIEQLKQMATKAEFSALQSKINPHFLFNALNAISTLIRIRPDDARQLIANLADFLRYNLERDVELIDIQDEIQQVRDYVAIEKARFGAKLEVVFDIDDVHSQIPCLLIQPLVENAILHGIQPSRVAGKVFISVKKKVDDVVVTITDTGVGIDQQTIDKLYQGKIESHHIGLNNVHQRLLLLYSDGLHICRLEQGTSMQFFIKNQD